ncbi:MAG: permease-like cell division protein FtsX [Candidatus Daviesbacteria bacterium]|nr:permease-like cell division protein FtsX [Candidatus Daviesbacteria bacterium]
MNSFDFTKRNIRRTPYQALAASMVMFLTFLTLSLFIMMAFGSQQILRFYESKPQAIAFFKDGTTSTDVNAIKNALTQTDKITSFKFVSKDEALQIYKQRNKGNPMLLELVTANILPASLEISTKSPDDLKFVAEIVKKEPVVEEVVFPEDVVASLTQATSLIRMVGIAIVGFLIAFSTLIIVMIIGFKIRIKRDEIETVKLLGATNWFIRMPFLLEGIIYACLGAILGFIVSFLIFWYFESVLKTNLGEAVQNIIPLPIIFIGELLAIELLVAFLVGGLGSIIAVRRYLRI